MQRGPTGAVVLQTSSSPDDQRVLHIKVCANAATETSEGVAGEAGHGRAGTASALGARRKRRHAIDGGVSTVRR